MAQNYTRQSSFNDGDTISASLFNDEYNQLVNSFSYSSSSESGTGHRHDGSAGQGGNIYRIGDLDFFNKIEADSTNNRWGFWVEVGGSAVEQVRIQDGAVLPVTTNDIDLGSGSLEFKDLHLSGSASFAGASTSADISFGDNNKAIFGAGSDLQIYHDGSNSYVADSGTGRLFLSSNGDGVNIVTSTGENLIRTDNDGQVRVYFDDSEKLRTNSTGIDVTGTVTADGLTVSGASAGTVTAATFTNTTSASGTRVQAVLQNVGSACNVNLVSERVGANFGADFIVETSDTVDGTDRQRLRIAETGDISFYEDTGTTARLVWDASADALTFGNDVKATFGSGPEFQIYYASGASVNLIESPNYNIQIGANAVDFTSYAGSLYATIDSGGINVTGTVTADGLTVDGSSSGRVTSAEFKNNLNAGGTEVAINLANQGGTSNADVNLVANRVGANFGSDFYIETSDGVDGTNRKRLNIGENGDISFYEDTGTTAKLFWDASAEALGIGTPSPATRFELSGVKDTSELRLSSTTNDASWAANQYFGKLSFYSADSSGAGAGIKGSIVSACTGGSSGATAHMAFSVASTTTNEVEAMRLDASGNLLVGKTASDTSSAGHELRPGSFAAHTVDGDVALNLRRLNSDGDIARFQKDGTTVGSIGALSSRLFIGSDDTFLTFQGASDRIYPALSSGGVRDAAIDLGYSAGRFKDLYLSGGVYLGGTGAANKLDDYEEGTFTASLTGSTSSPTPKVTATGNYRKIGAVVHFNVGFENISTTGYSGPILISGLPFSQISGSRSLVNIALYNDGVWSSGDHLVGIVPSTTNYVQFRRVIAGAAWQALEFKSTGSSRYFWASGTYTTTS